MLRHIHTLDAPEGVQRIAWFFYAKVRDPAGVIWAEESVASAKLTQKDWIIFDL